MNAHLAARHPVAPTVPSSLELLRGIDEQVMLKNPNYNEENHIGGVDLVVNRGIEPTTVATQLRSSLEQTASGGSQRQVGCWSSSTPIAPITQVSNASRNRTRSQPCSMATM